MTITTCTHCPICNSTLINDLYETSPGDFDAYRFHCPIKNKFISEFSYLIRDDIPLRQSIYFDNIKIINYYNSSNIIVPVAYLYIYSELSGKLHKALQFDFNIIIPDPFDKEILLNKIKLLLLFL